MNNITYENSKRINAHYWGSDLDVCVHVYYLTYLPYDSY